MFLDGYKYWIAFKKDGKTYYRCRRHRSKKGLGCPAKLWMDSKDSRHDHINTDHRLIPEHNHGPETERGLVDNFRKVLTRRSATEKIDLHTIYYDEAARYSEASLIYTYATAESAMAKARRKANASVALPETEDFCEVAEILKTTQNFRIVCYGHRDTFFEEAITRNASITGLIFAHRPTIRRFSALHEVQMDVSAISLSSGIEIFLLTIHHLDAAAKTTPLAYVLLNGKSPDIFAAIFTHIREHFNIIPTTVISDCLVDCLHESLSLTFPEASIKANWFEYVASVSKQLMHGPRDVAFNIKTGTNQIILRMILVLPFLPADYMAPGLEAIRKWMQDKGVDLVEGPLARLCRHVESTWLRGVGAGNLSMFRVTISVEDHMKEFHKELKSHWGNGPTLWRVIEGITAIAAKVNSRLIRAVGNTRERERVDVISKKSQVLSEAIIRNATEQWITQPIHLRSPLQFLQMVSHFITGTFLAAVLKTQNCDPSDISEDDLVTEVEPVECSNVLGQKKVDTKRQSMESSSSTKTSTEPPPLAFYPRVIARVRAKAKDNREPPPLVPIRRNK